MQNNKTVAIVGGGPCGILSAKHVLEEGLTPILFEMTNDIGGQWNQGSQMSGMWENLVVNSPKGLNNFSQLSIDDNLPIFTTSTGRYNRPYIPQKEGQKNFSGEIYHSFDYGRIKDKLINKKVLVVGSSVSSIEICQLLTDKAAKVINSQRTPRYVAPKVLGNYPVQYNQLTKSYYMAKYNEPSLFCKINENLKNKLGNIGDVGGLYRDPTICKAGMTIGQTYPGLISEGKIIERKSIKFIKQSSVVFEDDIEEDVDVIIYGTGFSINLDIVDDEIKKDLIIEGNDKFLNIYKQCLHPKLHDFSLMGVLLLTLTAFTPFELAARLVAMVFSGKKQLPSQNEIDEEQKKHIQWASTAKYIYPMEMTEELSTFIGCRPVYENHPDIAKALFFGPNFAEQFRLDGYGKDPNAKQAYLNSLRANKVQIQAGDYELNEFQKETLQKLLQKQPQNQELLQLQKIFKFESLPTIL